MGYQFKVPPIIKEADMPCEHSVDGLKDWLTNLAVLDKNRCCREIFCVLQTFSGLEMNVDEQASVLDKINEHLAIVVKHVEMDDLDSKFPLTVKELATVELITWAYIELSNNYEQLTRQLMNQKSLFPTKKKQAQFLYCALDALCIAHLKMVSVYIPTYKNFWPSIYQLFYLAEAYSLLKIPVILETKQQTSIYRLIKKLFLLELCDTNQFRPREIKQVLVFLEDYVDYAHIRLEIKTEKLQRVRMFNEEQQNSPEEIEGHQVLDETRYFLFANVVSKIFTLLQKKVKFSALEMLNRAIYLRAFKTLTFTQKRQHTRIAKNQLASGVMGLENIIHFYTKNNLSHQQETAFESKDIVNTMEEQHLSVELVGEYLSSQTIENDYLDLSIEAGEEITTVQFESFNVLNSSLGGYHILWNDDCARVQIGTVFGLMNETTGFIEVGLIRRISIIEKGLSLGIELLSLESQVVHISNPEQSEEENVPALLLDQDNLLLAATHFRPKDKILLKIKNKTTVCRLGQLLHTTSAINHFKIIFSHKTDEYGLVI